MNKKKRLKEESGTTAIEFAFVAPIMILLLAGISEYSFVLFSGLALDTQLASVARIGRLFSTNQSFDSKCNSSGYNASSSPVTANTITNCLNQRMKMLPAAANLKLCYVNYGNNWSNYNATSSGTCSNISSIPIYGSGSEISSNDNTQSIGSAGDTVVYYAAYDWKFMTPLISRFFTGTGNSGYLGTDKSNGTITITSSYVVNNNAR